MSFDDDDMTSTDGGTLDGTTPDGDGGADGGADSGGDGSADSGGDGAAGDGGADGGA